MNIVYGDMSMSELRGIVESQLFKLGVEVSEEFGYTSMVRKIFNLGWESATQVVTNSPFALVGLYTDFIDSDEGDLCFYVVSPSDHSLVLIPNDKMEYFASKLPTTNLSGLLREVKNGK